MSADPSGAQMAEEHARLGAVRRYDILDTPPDGAFDRVCALAIRIFGVPIAAVTIVDEERIWFKACAGLAVTEIGRDPGLCASAILQDDAYIVTDGLSDPRTAANPLVCGEAAVRFYAAAPIVTADGHRLGTVNIIDRVPRELEEQERQTLHDLAAIVMDELELRLAALRELGQERANRRQEAERSERLRLLMDAGALLDGSLEPEGVLHGIARLFVPRFGQMCSVSIVTEANVLELATFASTDSHMDRAISYLDEMHPMDPEGPHPIAEAMRARQATLIDRSTDELMSAAAINAGHLSAMRSLGPLSAVGAPMRARGRVFGVILIASPGTSSAYSEQDRRLIGEIAGRAALAYDNARLYEERRHVAETLQRSLLPNRLPEIPGLELASSYRAVDGDVGGDFYDAFEAGGEWAVVIGDVCGKGAEAAALTGLARHTIRTAASERIEPQSMLQLLNRAILREQTDYRFCTLALGRVRARNGGADVTLVCAGHPAPAVLRANGAVEFPLCSGPILGALDTVEADEVDLRLSAGDALVLYTDGLVEARCGDQGLGERGLEALLQPLARLSAPAITDGVERGLLELGADLRDDLALLVMSVPG